MNVSLGLLSLQTIELKDPRKISPRKKVHETLVHVEYQGRKEVHESRNKRPPPGNVRTVRK